jgi:hypothetical protein
VSTGTRPNSTKNKKLVPYQLFVFVFCQPIAPALTVCY